MPSTSPGSPRPGPGEQRLPFLLEPGQGSRRRRLRPVLEHGLSIGRGPDRVAGRLGRRSRSSHSQVGRIPPRTDPYTLPGGLYNVPDRPRADQRPAAAPLDGSTMGRCRTSARRPPIGARREGSSPCKESCSRVRATAPSSSARSTAQASSHLGGQPERADGLPPSPEPDGAVLRERKICTTVSGQLDVLPLLRTESRIVGFGPLDRRVHSPRRSDSSLRPMTLPTASSSSTAPTRNLCSIGSANGAPVGARRFVARPPTGSTGRRTVCSSSPTSPPDPRSFSERASPPETLQVNGGNQPSRSTTPRAGSLHQRATHRRAPRPPSPSEPRYHLPPRSA